MSGGEREEESLRGGEAPFFIKKFPLSLIKRGGQGGEVTYKFNNIRGRW